MPQELSEEVLQEVAPKTQQLKMVNEKIDAILDAEAEHTHPLWRIGDKIDTLNKLIAFALKQRYGRGG